MQLSNEVSTKTHKKGNIFWTTGVCWRKRL